MPGQKQSAYKSRSSRVTVRASLASLVLALALHLPAAHGEDLLLTGGVIHTMNPAQPTAEALVVSGDRIAFVGKLADAQELVDSSARRIDLRGGIAIPGLVDAHAHINNLSRLLTRVNLLETKSLEDVRDSALEHARWQAPGEWIIGRGWDQNDWEVQEFPTWRDLEGIDDHPVYFRRVDGHACWVNKRALQICGVDENTPDPPGGRIIRDSAGAPTGVFVDNAESLISDHIIDTSLVRRAARFRAALIECNRYGITSVHDAGVDAIDIAAYEALAESGDMTVRIYGMLSADEPGLVRKYFELGPQTLADGMLTIRSVKGYTDGALGSRGAALLEEYADEAGHRGLLVTQPDSILTLAKLCAEHGFQFCVHAIGDRGVRISLDAFEKVFEEMFEKMFERALGQYESDDSRFRIEHAQVIALEDIPRFAQLGVIPSMQPTHCTSDMYWAEDRVGPERIIGAYAWRKLLETGVRISLGSDFPVESVNPLWGIYAAVTRQDDKGWPEGGWYADQRLTVEEAVRGFTLDAAYGAFAENTTGSLEVGKLADITLLDKDIFTIPARQILETSTLATIVGGKVVYSRE